MTKTFLRFFAPLAVALLFSAANAAAGDLLKVVRVDDANTVVVSKAGKELTVRLLGVVVPDPGSQEKKVAEFGRYATDYLKGFLGTGWVMLEFPAGAASDELGRPLAFVYRGKDAVLVNERLLVDGYGIVPKDPPFPQRERFLRLEQDARTGRRGMWGPNSDQAANFGSGQRSQASYLDKVIGTGDEEDSWVDAWIIIFR